MGGASDLHARISLCNVASPAAPTRVWHEAITLDLFTAEGKLAASRSVRLAPYESQTVEVRDLLPKGVTSGHGLLRVDTTIAAHRAPSAFTRTCITIAVDVRTREVQRLPEGPSRVLDVVGVPSSARLDVSLIVVNGTEGLLSGHVVLTNVRGERREGAAVRVPPLGTSLIRLREAVPTDRLACPRHGHGTATFRRGVIKVLPRARPGGRHMASAAPLKPVIGYQPTGAQDRWLSLWAWGYETARRTRPST